MRKLHLMTLVGGMLVFSCTRESGSRHDTRGPADRRTPGETGGRAAKLSSWPAFQRGGSLQGRADALPLERMRLRWEYKIGGGARSSAAIVDGSVYIGGADGAVHAIVLASGEARWKYETGSDFCTVPLVSEGKLFIGDTAGVLHAVSIADGAQVWTFKTEGEIKSSANRWGTSVLFGSYDGKLYCVDAKTGHELWKFETTAPVHATPSVVDGITFCGGCDAVLRAIHLEGREAGREKWKFELGDRIAAAPVGFDGPVGSTTLSGRRGKVAVAGLGGLVACFDVADGRELWRREIETEELFGSPAFSEGLLFVPGRSKAAYCIDAETGEIKWTFESRSGFDGAPAVAGEAVYFPGKDGKLHVIDVKTGEEVWHFPAGGSIEGSPAVGEGALVFCDTAGTVYCLSPPETH